MEPRQFIQPGARGEAAVNGDREVANLVAAFLGKPKSIARWSRWRSKAHPDYAEAGSIVLVDDGSLTAGRLIVTAHRLRRPRKLGFTLDWQGRRILGLDVEPGATHFNPTSRTVVAGTHWQAWPLLEAEEDRRELPFPAWLDAFCRRAHILTTEPLREPPFTEEEPELPL